MRVWELQITEIDHSPFYIPEEKELQIFKEKLDDIIEGNESIIDDWKPLLILKGEQKIDPDFFDLYDSGVQVLSVDAAAAIMLCLPEDTYELLDMVSDENKYFLLNIIKPTNCLDKENSSFNSFPDGMISDYEHLAFHYDKVINVPIFRIPELPYTLFVTHVFEYIYNMENLKGLNFSDHNLVYVD